MGDQANSNIHVIGVDVGTSSVRLAIVKFSGAGNSVVDVIASHKKHLSVVANPPRYEQNSAEIWAAICECSKACLKKSSLDPQTIRAISFSATCSLVIVDDDNENGQNLTESKKDTRDIIMWMDHRADVEANAITNADEEVTQRFGGRCSSEFSLSKLVWLEANDSERFKSVKGFFELNDWLVYRCIGGKPDECPRSLCSLALKWGYNSETKQHCATVQKLIRSTNLGDKLGKTIIPPGTSAGLMSFEAAADLGLIEVTVDVDDSTDKETKGVDESTNIIVATSLIDAHAGMLGMLSVPIDGKVSKFSQAPEGAMVLCSLVGTSCCHLILSELHRYKSGVWGPFKNAILKDLFLLEAGQSYVGKLIEKTIETHSEGKMKLARGDTIHDIIKHLNRRISVKYHKTKLHVLPFHHGSRTPHNEPNLKGGIYGLGPDCETSLIDLYVATVEALVFENRYILDILGRQDQPDLILVSGGLAKNAFYMQTLASVLNTRIVQLAVADIDFMVLGSCLVAKHAVLNGTQPMTVGSMGTYQFQGINVVDTHPELDLYEYYERRYSQFLYFAHFACNMHEAETNGIKHRLRS